MKPVPLTNPITTFLPKFQGGSGPPDPPLDPRMSYNVFLSYVSLVHKNAALFGNGLTLTKKAFESTVGKG